MLASITALGPFVWKKIVADVSAYGDVMVMPCEPFCGSCSRRKRTSNHGLIFRATCVYGQFQYSVLTLPLLDDLVPFPERALPRVASRWQRYVSLLPLQSAEDCSLTHPAGLDESTALGKPKAMSSLAGNAGRCRFWNLPSQRRAHMDFLPLACSLVSLTSRRMHLGSNVIGYVNGTYCLVIPLQSLQCKPHSKILPTWPRAVTRN